MNSSQLQKQNGSVNDYFHSFDSLAVRQKKQDQRNSNYENGHKFLGLRLISAFSSVVISECLLTYTWGKYIFSKLYEKGSKTEDKNKWVTRQTRHLLKTMIRYNSIIFGTKVLLDNHYAQTLRQNQLYYQSNSKLHFKIGALVGLIAYFTTVPINEFQSIKAINRSSSNFLTGGQKPTRFGLFAQTLKQLFTVPALKRMVNHINFSSMLGAVIFRSIYFGGYQKIKSKYSGPLNEYIIAPIVCSSLTLIVTPFDQIKILQMTKDKGKSFLEILMEKGFKLWNLQGEKMYTSVAKQSLSMSLFVIGQNLCKSLIEITNSNKGSTY